MLHGTNAERILKAQMEEQRATDAPQDDRDQEPQRSFGFDLQDGKQAAKEEHEHDER